MNSARTLPKETVRTIQGAPSWRIANDVVEAWITRDGGHLGPVNFNTPIGRIQPYSVAPWLPREVARNSPRVLRNLRGDFFCLPFGADAKPWRRESHPLHGETAGARWRYVSCIRSDAGIELVAQLNPKVRSGLVTKRIRILPGQTVLYCSHEIAGMEGPMSLGHHAMLRFPDRNGSGHIACSGFRFGQIRPADGSDLGFANHSRLQPGKTFRDLHRVPQKAGDYADLTRFPARLGFDDLVLLATRRTQTLAWFTVTFPHERYLWFSLKNPRQLTSTLLWHSNGGFNTPPWNGQHRPVMGIEEITGYFDFGLRASVHPNTLSRQGVPTTLSLSSRQTLRIPYVMGIAILPRGFDSVRRVRFEPDHILFSSNSKLDVRQPIDWRFFTEKPDSMSQPKRPSIKNMRGVKR